MARVRARKHKKHTEIGERHAEEARDRERRREKDDRIYRLHLPEHKKPIGGREGRKKKGKKGRGLGKARGGRKKRARARGNAAGRTESEFGAAEYREPFNPPRSSEPRTAANAKLKVRGARGREEAKLAKKGDREKNPFRRARATERIDHRIATLWHFLTVVSYSREKKIILFYFFHFPINLSFFFY